MKTITLLLAASGALFLSSCACSKSGSCCATKSSSGGQSCEMSTTKGEMPLKKGTAAKHDMKSM